jgi:hypothetical protein
MTPTLAELQARIAALEEKLAHKPRRRSDAKAEKAARKARAAKFKLEAWRRAHSHTSINRYAR